MYTVSKDTIRKIIIDKLVWCEEHSDQGEADFNLNHYDGIIRGLVWAYTGEDPGSGLLRDCAPILKLVNIPYVVTDENICYDNGDGTWGETVKGLTAKGYVEVYSDYVDQS